MSHKNSQIRNSSAKTIELKVNYTPAQFRVLRKAARSIRATPEQLASALSCDELESLTSREDFQFTANDSIARFVVNRRPLHVGFAVN
jgi:hypothetical protein